MSIDEVTLAEAIAVYRMHGDRIYEMVAERLGALDHEGDLEDIDRFTAIAAKIDQFLRGGGTSN